MKLRAALVACDGNFTAAARQLGLDRTTFWRYIREDNQRLERWMDKN